MEYITVVSLCRCKPNMADEFLDALGGFVSSSREEAGCISYDVYQDTQDACNVIFHEVWKDQDGINYHINSKHFSAFMEKSSVLLEDHDGMFKVTIASLFDPQAPPEGEEIIVATLCQALPGKNRDIREAAPEEILQPSSAEPGCAGYQLFQGVEQKDLFLLYETWNGFAAIQDHMGTTHFSEFMKKAPTYFAPLENKELFTVNICTPYA